MSLLPYLHLMPRVDRDIEACLRLVGRQPWGKPRARSVDIGAGIARALMLPKSNRANAFRPSTGIELRRCDTAQFAIVYAYLLPTAAHPRGVVSIRAVRHSRVRDVFSGVKETGSYENCDTK